MATSLGEKSVSILIAEDDRIMRKLLVTHLESWDYRVIATEDGVECLSAFESEENISLAILDWMMPGMDGPEVCRRIKQAGGSFVYVMMLTAMTEKEQIVKALSTGADDYLAKPWNPAELEARIRAGLRVVKLESALRMKTDKLQQALDRVESLRDILPICTRCHKTRNDTNYWRSVEEYFETYSHTRSTHGICPDCAKQVAEPAQT